MIANHYDETSSLLYGHLPRRYIPRRYMMAVMIHCSILICYILRVNLSVAAINIAEDYHWSKETKGIVLSAFFWGYITTQLIGGYMSQRFGGKIMLSFGVLWPAIFTCITPLVVEHIPLVVACRVLTGFGEGVLFPTIYNIVGYWIPFQEKGTIVAFIWCGCYAGTIVGTLMSTPIINNLGWPWVFYIAGFAGIVWFIIWLIFAADKPEKSKFIHPSEILYIVNNSESFLTNQAAEKENPHVNIKLNDSFTKPAPKEISSTQALAVLVTKPAFWSIVLCNLTVNWGFYVLLAWLPTYYTDELGFSEFESGLMSVLPSVATLVLSFCGGTLNDVFVARGTKPLIARRTFNFLANLFPSTALVLISFIPMNRYVVAAILAVGMGGQGFNTAGYTLNVLEIAPKHASLVSGIANTAGTIPGIVGVASTGFLLADFGGSWTAVFMAPVFFYALGFIVFSVFSSTQRIV